MVLREMLEGMRSEGTTLTVRSLKLLQLPGHELDGFVNLHKHAQLKRQVST